MILWAPWAGPASWRVDVYKRQGIHTPVRMLSGGNVQKVLLGREIDSAPAILISAYPVRGLDINSTYTIYNLLNEQKEKGVAVLFIGEDLDVLLELSDRILVLDVYKRQDRHHVRGESGKIHWGNPSGQS